MEQTKKNKKNGIVLLVLCLPLFILAIDNTVLSLALPKISDDLGSSASQLQWIVDAYILGFASLLLTMGTIGDRFGRKRLLHIGMVLFGIGSLAAALSTSTGMLIACRAFMGIGGAITIPSTLSILIDTFRDPKQRAQAIAVWAAVFALGAGIGPVIGGYLLQYFNWSAVFYINIPVVIITLAGQRLFIRESTGEGAPKPDLLGVILSSVGLFALVYGIIRAGETSWTNSTVAICLATAIILIAIFAWLEKRSMNPMLPMEFFKNMSFTGASVALILISFALMGSMFFLSQYFQSVQGYSPVAAALRMIPMAITVFIMAILSARIANRIGIKLAVSLGIVISGAGLFYLSMAEVNTAYPQLLGGIALLGFGMGIVQSPATNSVMGSLPVNRAGVGSAMNSTVRQTGGALGVAVLGAVMNAIYLDKVKHLEVMATLPPKAADAVRSSIQGAHIVAGQPQIPPNVSQAITEGANQAFTLGMTDAMFIGAIIMWAAAIFTFIFLPSQVQAPQEHMRPTNIPAIECVEERDTP